MSKKFRNHMAIHYILATFSFAATFLLLRSLPLALFSSAISIFLDADHLLDYFLANGADLNPQKFLREVTTGKYFNRSGKIYVPLHSWELLAIVVAASAQFNHVPWGICFALGFVPHLLWDQITYAKRPWMYFFFYRAKCNFSQKLLC